MASRPASTRPRSTAARPACCTATAAIYLQDDDGQILDTHSISAGLDYPGVGPEHAWLFDHKRVEYVPVTDEEALAGFQLLTRLEGIIPALGIGPCHRRGGETRARACPRTICW